MLLDAAVDAYAPGARCVAYFDESDLIQREESAFCDRAGPASLRSAACCLNPYAPPKRPYSMAASLNRERSERTLRYNGLRQAYDSAFREWILQTRRNDSQETKDLEDDGAMKSSPRVVRDRRDAMVEFLLSTPQSFRPAESQVREAAYFIWVNAGRPKETAMSDWITASRKLALSDRSLVAEHS